MSIGIVDYISRTYSNYQGPFQFDVESWQDVTQKDEGAGGELQGLGSASDIGQA